MIIVLASEQNALLVDDDGRADLALVLLYERIKLQHPEDCTLFIEPANPELISNLYAAVEGLTKLKKDYQEQVIAMSKKDYQEQISAISKKEDAALKAMRQLQLEKFQSHVSAAKTVLLKDMTINLHNTLDQLAPEVLLKDSKNLYVIGHGMPGLCAIRVYQAGRDSSKSIEVSANIFANAIVLPVLDKLHSTRELAIGTTASDAAVAASGAGTAASGAGIGASSSLDLLICFADANPNIHHSKFFTSSLTTVIKQSIADKSYASITIISSKSLVQALDYYLTGNLDCSYTDTMDSCLRSRMRRKDYFHYADGKEAISHIVSEVGALTKMTASALGFKHDENIDVYEDGLQAKFEEYLAGINDNKRAAASMDIREYNHQAVTDILINIMHTQLLKIAAFQLRQCYDTLMHIGLSKYVEEHSDQEELVDALSALQEKYALHIFHPMYIENCISLVCHFCSDAIVAGRKRIQALIDDIERYGEMLEDIRPLFTTMPHGKKTTVLVDDFDIVDVEIFLPRSASHTFGMH